MNRSLARRIFGFSALPLLAALVPLLALPVVSRIATTDEWAALLVGQSVGAYASTVAYLGWNVLGTPRIARIADEQTRRELYARSYFGRVAVLCLAAPVAMGISWWLVGADSGWLAALFSLGSSLTSLGVAWYAVGVGTPSLIALYDLLPRVAVTAVAVIFVAVTGAPAYYAAATVFAPLIGVVLFNRRVSGRFIPRWPGLSVLRGDALRHRSAWGVEVVGNLYANAPTPVAAAVGTPISAAEYGSGDKVYRYGLLAVIAVSNAFQAWVLETQGAVRVRRSVTSIIVMVAVGVSGGGFLILFGEQLSRLLFGERHGSSAATMLWLGIAYFCVSASTPFIRNLLIPGGLAFGVFVATIVCAVSGVATMIIGGAAVGAPGVALGLAVSESLMLVACVCMAFRTGLRGAKDVHLD